MPKTSTRPPFAKKPAHQLPPRPLQLQNERLGSWLRPLLKQKNKAQGANPWDFDGTSMGLQQARLSWDMKGALQVVAFDRDR